MGAALLPVVAVVPAAVQDLESKGASSASTAAGAATGADAVVTMLPSSPHVKEVYNPTLSLSFLPCMLGSHTH